MPNKAKDLYIKVQGASSLAVDFSADDTTPDTNQIVTFTDSTVGATSWTWDFGDGKSSTLQNPTHEYELAGTYTVTLAASDGSAEGIETKTNYITVTLQGLAGTPYAWYKAPIGASPSNLTLVSGSVSQWNDESGNGFHISQATPANRPEYINNVLGGYGLLHFQGVTSALFRSDAAMARNGSTQTIMFVAVRLEVGSSGDSWTGAASHNGASNIYTDTSNGFKAQNGVALPNYQPVIYSKPFILTVVYNGVNSYMQVDNVPTIFALANIGTFASGTGIVLGNRASLDAAPQMYMAEFITFNAALTSLQIASNIQYFSSKLNLHLH